MRDGTIELCECSGDPCAGDPGSGRYCRVAALRNGFTIHEPRSGTSLSDAVKAARGGNAPTPKRSFA